MSLEFDMVRVAVCAARGRGGWQRVHVLLHEAVAVAHGTGHNAPRVPHAEDSV